MHPAFKMMATDETLKYLTWIWTPSYVLHKRVQQMNAMFNYAFII